MCWAASRVPPSTYILVEAGTQRYNVGTDTPKLWATSLGGVPEESNFLAALTLPSVIRRFRPPTRPCRFAASNPACVRSIISSRSIDFVDGVLKVMPLTSAVPEEAEALIRQAYALLPHAKSMRRGRGATTKSRRSHAREPENRRRDQALAHAIFYEFLLQLGVYTLTCTN